MIKYGVLLLIILSMTLTLVAQDSTCEAGFVWLENDRLASDPLCVPQNPERIVALDPFTFELLVALDIPLVAIPQVYVETLTSNFSQFDDYFTDILDTGIPVNFETLLAATPDIILCRQSACADQYDSLSQVAPTVMFANESAADWRDSAHFYAEVLNTTDELATVEAQFDERLATLTGLVEMNFPDQAPTITVLRVRPNQLRLYFAESSAGVVWSEAGFVSPDSQSDLLTASAERFGIPRLMNISLEQIPLIDADYAFVFVTDGLTDGDGQDYLERVVDNPLWGHPV
ncbi:MAG: ABC transporter substrate-binding protein [Chloroflexota bacterium]